MDYAIVFEIADPTLRFAAAAAVGTVFLIILLIAAILLLRAARKFGEWRARVLMHDWRPLLAQCAVAAPESVSPLARGDRYAFLTLWNHHYELLRGDAQQNLRALAQRAGIPPFVRRLLASFSLRKRLIAATTLGHLHDAQSVAALDQLTHHHSPTLSFAAARALIEINPGAQLPKLLPLIASRRDWPLSAIALVLNDLGAEVYSAALAHAVLEASQHTAARSGLPRLLQLMELAQTGQISTDIETLLRRAEYVGPDVISSCLRLLNDPRQAHWARQFLAHSVWYVRMAAATALRRIGAIEDYEPLMELVADAHWWVRYRAAQALARLPGITPELMEAAAANSRDRFAAQMLLHVAAEERLA